MASDRRKMNFTGTQQTCYSDWAKSVLEYYPYNPRFQLEDDGEKVSVYFGQEQIAQYDFGSGTAYILENNPKRTLQDVGRVANYQEMPVDNLLF